MIKKSTVALIVIFVFSLALRLFFAFKSPQFSDAGAYDVMRQVDHIAKTGLPFYYDNLSYGGRHLAFLPVFYYALAFFNLFMPVSLVLKIMPNIFASFLALFVYIIVMHITKNQYVSIFAAAISSLIPIFTSLTVNSVSAYSFALPLILLTIYFFMKAAEEKKYTTYFLVCFFVLTFTHASVFVLVSGFLIYLILAKVEGLKINRTELEMIIFATFFAIWSYFIMFKKLFLSPGASVLSQNIPTALLYQYFRQVTVIGALNQIGLIPLFAGIYVLYKYLFQIKNKSIYLMISFAIATALLLWLRLFSYSGGLMILGAVLVVFLGQFLVNFLSYVEKTKLLAYKSYFVGALIFLFVGTSLAPTIFYADQQIKRAFNANDIDAMLWLKNNTEEKAVVLAMPAEGSLVTAIANRSNVMDTNYLLANDVEQRLSDIDTVFSTSSEIEAVTLLTKYNVHYLYFSDDAKLKYKRLSLPYSDDYNCFQLVYYREVEIYLIRCKLESIT